jgi:hypothetical protein
MTIDSLLWLPVDLVIAGTWYWLVRNKYVGLRLGCRVIVGSVSMSLTTIAASLITVTIIYSWVTGSLVGVSQVISTVATLSILLSIIAAVASIVAPGRLRVVGLSLSLLVLLSWIWYIVERLRGWR